MIAIKSLSLFVAFLLELAVLAAAGYWGFKTSSNLATKLLAGLGTPVLFGAVWGVFGAPHAPLALHGPGRAILEICWFGGGAAALAAAAATLPAIVPPPPTSRTPPSCTCGSLSTPEQVPG